MQTRREVSWLTSLPAPYRFAIWDYLAEAHNLKVIFTNGESNQRGWQVPKDVKWTSKFLNRKIFYLGEAQIIPNPFGFHMLFKDADVIIIGGGWEVPLHFTSAIYAKLTGKSLYIISESTLMSHRFRGKIANNCRRLFYRLADRVFTVGVASTDAVKSYGVKTADIVQLFNPVNAQFFFEKAKLQRINNLKGHHYLCVGRLLTLKNFQSVIEALKDMNNLQSTLTIVGIGPEESKLKELVRFHSLQNQVRFVGAKSQEEIVEYYANCQTLIMASTNEVWGMVASEALSSGCHVVVSEVSGISKSIKDMRGVYISGTDVYSIKECMVKSALDYSGPIENPEILKFTPQRFGQAITDTIRNRSLQNKK